MGKIIIVFKIFVAVLIFYIFGYLLRLSFRQIPEWLFIALFVILLITLVFFVFKSRKNALEAGDTNEDMPSYLQKSVYFYLIVGCFIGNYLSSAEFKAILIVDNGYSFPVEVAFPNGEKYTVSQHNHISAPITTGYNIIVINGDSIEINIAGSGRWIYNIDNLNQYLITTVDYSNPDVLYHDGNVENLNLEKPLAEKVSETFFEVKTDFLFKAPETISSSGKTKQEHIRKTILLRIPPTSEGNSKDIIIETY